MEKQSFKGVPESNWVVGPCQTEEIAKQVLAVAHAYGWKWCSDKLFIDKTNWNEYKKGTYYNIAIGEYCDLWYWKSRKFTIIPPETFLANNPMPEEKTRKPGVKYTLEDWKKEADACRKRAEYWKDKFHALEKTANSVADSMTEVLKTHEKLQLDLDTTNKNFTILQTANKVLKESNENLRNSNDELLKSSTEAKQELGFAKLKIQDLEKERDELGNGNDLLLKSLETASKDLEIANEELKTVKSHLDLRTKGIQALEQDAKIYRHEIGLWKDTIESYKKDLITWSEGSQKQVEEFDALQSNFEVLEENYNGLQIDNKWTKVIAWVGWIAWFLCMGFIMFFKG